MPQLTLTCPGIECDACANAIKRSVGRLSGVNEVVVDGAARAVTVTYSDAAEGATAVPGAIRDRLAEAGFEAE